MRAASRGCIAHQSMRGGGVTRQMFAATSRVARRYGDTGDRPAPLLEPANARSTLPTEIRPAVGARRQRRSAATSALAFSAAADQSHRFTRTKVETHVRQAQDTGERGTRTTPARGELGNVRGWARESHREGRPRGRRGGRTSAPRPRGRLRWRGTRPPAAGTGDTAPAPARARSDGLQSESPSRDAQAVTRSARPSVAAARARPKAPVDISVGVALVFG